MTEHEVSRVVQASSAAVFEVVSDLRRLPEWLPTVQVAEPAAPGTDTDVHVEGDAGGGYASDGFWRPSPDQLRVEWGTPSRGGEGGTYAGWLQVEDRSAGCEVVVHLSFFEGEGPPGIEQGLAGALDALADLVE
ncbi:MAG TPA: SRPBCC family protein [Mycobacteriales bacterium]|jgi:uncharacterized protein YndB with AHSA1/START domain|nr:SRPBCC family protein [Mycobacteriales bacterium]